MSSTDSNIGSAMSERLILTINAGSSSLKVGVFDAETGERLAGNALDWRDGNDEAGNRLASLEDLLMGIDLSAVYGIGHRVVQGGTRLRDSVKIDETIISIIDELAVLAPLH